MIAGKPRIEGTRIGVHNVVELVIEDGYTATEVAEQVYPHLSVEDVNAALEYFDANEAEVKQIIRSIRSKEETLENQLISSPEELPPHLSNGA